MNRENVGGAASHGKVALGAMNFGKRTAKADAERIIARALERGVTFIDTANAYNDGESERIVGRAVKSRRDAVQIATKVGFGRIGGKPEGLAKTRVLAAIDESLARLETNYVDVYYLHAPDPKTPIDETLDAIAEVLASGKARAFAVSNYASWQGLEIMLKCDARGISRPAMSQVIYNLLIRQLDLEYRGFTRAHPIHTTIYNPLAGGLLTGRHDRSGSAVAGSRFDKNALYRGRYLSDRMFDMVDAYAAFAKEHGLGLVELAYGFVASADFVDSVIVGPGTIAHLDAALDALAKPLATEVRTKLDALSKTLAGTETSYAR